MKKILYFLIAVSISLNSYSQMKPSGKSFNVSEPYKVFDAKTKLYFAKGKEAMAIKFDGDDIIIQKFDAEKPSFVKEKKYEKFFPKNYAVEEITELNNKYYFFFSSWDGGDNKKEQCFSIEIDFEKGEFIDAPKLMFQVDGKIAGNAVAVMTGGFSYEIKPGYKFKFFKSHDKKNILIEYRKKPDVKSDVKSYDIIGLHTYDSNLNKIASNEFTMPYTERRMDNLDYQVDNQGNLYLLVKVYNDDSYDEKRKKKDEEANYHIELFLIKSGSSKIEISKFENKDKFINKLWLFDTDKDILVCAGFYSNGHVDSKNDFNDSDGIVTFKIKTDGSIYDQAFNEIPTEVLNQYETEKNKKRNEKKERKGEGAQFSDLEMKTLAINKDGSIVIVGEQTFMIMQGGYSALGGSSRMHTTYHYCDLLVSKINPDGKIDWMKRIPKNQKGNIGLGGMSFNYFNANNNHYLVYLDNIKNIDLPLDKEPAQHSDGKGGYLTVVKIADSDGTLKKESILNAREIEDFEIYQYSTNRVFKTSQDSFMFEAYKKKKEDVMIKVNLN